MRYNGKTSACRWVYSPRITPSPASSAPDRCRAPVAGRPPPPVRWWPSARPSASTARYPPVAPALPPPAPRPAARRPASLPADAASSSAGSNAQRYRRNGRPSMRLFYRPLHRDRHGGTMIFRCQRTACTHCGDDDCRHFRQEVSGQI